MEEKEFVIIEDRKMPKDDYYKKKSNNGGFISFIFLVNIVLTFIMWILLLV